MFRKPNKNAFDESRGIYTDDTPLPQSFNKYKRQDHQDVFEPQKIVHQTQQTRSDEAQKWASETSRYISNQLQNAPSELIEEPETTLGEGVSFKGELSFDKLLRIDGCFEGSLISEGKIIIGPKGRVKADINLQEAIIEGHVEGNISAAIKVELRGGASVKGNITTKSICIDDGVKINGLLLVGEEIES